MEEKKHKLDILLEDITELGKDPLVAKNISAQFRVSPPHPSDGLKRCEIRLDIDNITVWYRTSVIGKLGWVDEADAIWSMKNVYYHELLMYILLTRLPLWREQTVAMT